MQVEDIGDGDVQEDETGWGLGLLMWTCALMMSSEFGQQAAGALLGLGQALQFWFAVKSAKPVKLVCQVSLAYSAGSLPCAHCLCGISNYITISGYFWLATVKAGLVNLATLPNLVYMSCKPDHLRPGSF